MAENILKLYPTNIIIQINNIFFTTSLNNVPFSITLLMLTTNN